MYEGEMCEHEKAGYRHLSVNETVKHLNMHYQRALQELVDDKLIVDPAGISSYAESLVVADALRRSALSQVPWDLVLHHIFHSTYGLGKRCQAMGILNGATPEQPEDDV